MNELKHLESIKGCGTSMITLTLAPTPNSLQSALDLLKKEMSMSANIKSRL